MAESAPPVGALPEVKSVAQQAPTAVAGMFAKRARRRDVEESVAPAVVRAPAPARPRPMDDDDNDAGVDLAAIARARPEPVKPKVVETTFGALLKSAKATAAAVNEDDDDDDDAAPVFESVGPSTPPMKSTKLAALALGRMTIRR